MDDEEEAIAIGTWPLLQLAAAAEAAAATGSGCKDADAEGADVVGGATIGSCFFTSSTAGESSRTSTCANHSRPSSELALAA